MASEEKTSVFREDKLRAIDEAIGAAIEQGDIPGAVLWLESKGEAYHKAYGSRMTDPSTEKMTEDTVFDLASLTKVLATAPSILKLHERGKIDLDAPISEYLPEFLDGGVLPDANPEKPGDREFTEEEKAELVTPEQREEITVTMLLTHQSGLPPGIFLRDKDFWGHEEGVRRALSIGLKDRPGTRFRYSDVNFILLGEIVRRVSGQRLDEFAHEHFYSPLGMGDTLFQPPARGLTRIAPTTVIDGYGLLRGLVHDPTARRMEGVAGHAGLFSTAADVATFLRTVLGGGALGGVRVLEEETVELSLRNHLPESFGFARGLGWDISSGFAHQRGERFPRQGFGHTGWTGTSFWADPASGTFVILLANRNHPSEAGRTKQLRIEVGTLAGEAVGYTEPVPLSAGEAKKVPGSSSGGPAGEGSRVAPVAGADVVARTAPIARTAAGDGPEVLSGIDVLETEDFARLSGARVGLITNHTGINRQRRSTIDLLDEAPGVDLVALFSPEHGIRGNLETSSIGDGVDDATGLPIHSLYKSKERKPTTGQLKGISTLVFDIQDIGCRFYTYISTMGLSMEAAAEAGIRFVVLDRVNPIGGEIVDGPVRMGEGNNFTAFHDIPVQHGMTAGELARMFREERELDLELEVVALEGWNPAMRFDETGLPWVNPSPNMRNLTEALLYPGVGLIEFTNLSVGRGTPTPFELVGAPWIDHGRFNALLEEEDLPGLRLLPIRFTPQASRYEREDCGGVRFRISDRDVFRPLDLGLALARAIHELYPDTYDLAEKGNVLLRHPPTLEALLAGASNEEIRAGWEPELENFLKRRENFLLYGR